MGRLRSRNNIPGLKFPWKLDEDLDFGHDNCPDEI
jgi:hypothetical protein